MQKRKDQIVIDLFNILYQANLADTDQNDLDPINSRQNNLFGHIAEAIKSLGYEEDYNHYVETNEPTDRLLTLAASLEG